METLSKARALLGATCLLFLLPGLLPAFAAEPLEGTRISLAANSSMNLPHDELVVLYRIEASGREAAGLRTKVNRMARAIHAKLGKEKGLKLTTLSRRMELLWRYDKVSRRQVRDGWKLVQREQIRSTNLAAAADWIDAIEQAGGHLDSLRYGFSDATLQQTRASLRLKAVAQFRQKAAEMARALDAKSFRIVNLQTAHDTPRYPVALEMGRMKSADAAPSLNSGEGRISVTVSGSILLPPKDFPVP